MQSKLFPCVLGALLLSTSLTAFAQPPKPAEVSNPEITAPEVIAHIKYLASDELQGRGSGTEGGNKAADYLAQLFKAAKLEPAGDNHTYFQKFHVLTGVKLAAGNALSLGTGDVEQVLKVRDEFMPLSFSKNGTARAPIVFVGYGISRPDLGYDDYAGVEVKGKIVLVLRHTPDGDDAGKFGPNALLTYKTMTAREKGAAGILLLTGPASDGPENLGRFSLSSDSADCGIPAAFVKRDAIEKLIAPKHLQDLQVAMAHGKPASFDIPKSTGTITVNVERERPLTQNVVGLLRGSDPKLRDEVVVLGAHYDHLGMGGEHSLSDTDKPEIHHGADDNASGTAGVLELAQYFSAHRKQLKRSVLFMCFSGEELGLLGSNYWTKQPTIPLGRVAAMVNMDMIGRMRNDTVQVLGTGTSPAFPALLEEVNKPFHLQLKTGGAGGSSGFGSSDQQSFYAKEIPVLFFFTGVHPDYHKPTDTWDKINAEGEAKILKLVAAVVEQLSDEPARPQYVRAKEAESSPGPGFSVYLGTIPDYAAEVEGVQLQGVKEGGPAEKGGLRAGDILVEFDGKKIRNVEEYTAVLSGAKANVPVKITVLRNKQRMTFTITPLPRRG